MRRGHKDINDRLYVGHEQEEPAGEGNIAVAAQEALRNGFSGAGNGGSASFMECGLLKLSLHETVLTNEEEHELMRLDLIRMVDLRQADDGMSSFSDD